MPQHNKSIEITLEKLAMISINSKLLFLSAKALNVLRQSYGLAFGKQERQVVRQFEKPITELPLGELVWLANYIGFPCTMDDTGGLSDFLATPYFTLSNGLNSQWKNDIDKQYNIKTVA